MTIREKMVALLKATEEDIVTDIKYMYTISDMSLFILIARKSDTELIFQVAQVDDLGNIMIMKEL
jgi:hypothetical protein